MPMIPNLTYRPFAMNEGGLHSLAVVFILGLVYTMMVPCVHNSSKHDRGQVCPLSQ